MAGDIPTGGLVGLAFVYLFWFLFGPMEIGEKNDYSYTNFLGGIVLLIVPTILVLILILIRKHRIWSAILIFLTISILCLIAIFTAAFIPRPEHAAEFGKFNYYVVSLRDSDMHELDEFYKCKKWSLGCIGLYGSLSLTGTRIIVDKQKNEVSLFKLGFSRLLYTDGENPRSYTGMGGQLGDHTYYVSEKCESWKVYHYDHCTYSIYKCDLQSISCNRIPFKYKGEDIYAFFESNKTSNEISLYDENTLIFTYGSHPRCYVEGCVITDK